MEQIGPWTPSARESDYLELYKQAVDDCRSEGLPTTKENVMAKMRGKGQGIVHDAHIPEGQKKPVGRPPSHRSGTVRHAPDV